MDEVKPAACVPTVEHREPCESRGSRTVLGAPGGEIPPGDSTGTTIPLADSIPPSPRARARSRFERNSAHKRAADGAPIIG